MVMMALFEYMKKDAVTPLLIGGMMLVMLVAFLMVYTWLEKKHRKMFIGYVTSYFSSFYFLFAAFLTRKFQTLGLYLPVSRMTHLVLFVFTWFISICCLVNLIYKITEDKKECDLKMEPKDLL